MISGLRDDNPKRDNVKLALFMLLGITLLMFSGHRAQRGAIGTAARDDGFTTSGAGFPRGCNRREARPRVFS